MSKIYGVLLTNQGWQDLEQGLKPYYSEGPIGKYIYCSNVRPDGPYFVMEAIVKNSDGSDFNAEILIPHHYVKLVISASEKSQIGFISQ